LRKREGVREKEGRDKGIERGGVSDKERGEEREI
jgi:hypothetical protein